MEGKSKVVPFKPVHQQVIFKLWWEGWESTLSVNVNQLHAETSKKVARASATSLGVLSITFLGEQVQFKLAKGSFLNSGSLSPPEPVASSLSNFYAQGLSKAVALSKAAVVASGIALVASILFGRKAIMALAKRDLEKNLRASGNDDMHDIYRSWMQNNSRFYFTAVSTESTKHSRQKRRWFAPRNAEERRAENTPALDKEKTEADASPCGEDDEDEEGEVLGGAGVHVGYVGLPFVPGLDSPDAPKFSETDATIFRMVVRSSSRRQGVAGNLLAAVEGHARARGCRRIFASTANPAAAKCYERYGYREVYSYVMTPPSQGGAVRAATRDRDGEDKSASDAEKVSRTHVVKTLMKTLV